MEKNETRLMRWWQLCNEKYTPDGKYQKVCQNCRNKIQYGSNDKRQKYREVIEKRLKQNDNINIQIRCKTIK